MHHVRLISIRAAHSAQRTAHSAQRTAHSAQRTAHSAQTEAHLRQKFPPRRLLSGSALAAAALLSAGGALAAPTFTDYYTVTTGQNANFVTIADILVDPSDPAVAVTSYTVVNPAGGQLPGVTTNSIAGCSIAIANFANNPVVYPCTATINAALDTITVTGFPANLPTGGGGVVTCR